RRRFGLRQRAGGDDQNGAGRPDSHGRRKWPGGAWRRDGRGGRGGGGGGGGDAGAEPGGEMAGGAGAEEHGGGASAEGRRRDVVGRSGGDLGCDQSSPKCTTLRGSSDRPYRPAPEPRSPT